jgi:hypothetical protein
MRKEQGRLCLETRRKKEKKIMGRMEHIKDE